MWKKLLVDEMNFSHCERRLEIDKVEGDQLGDAGILVFLWFILLTYLITLNANYIIVLISRLFLFFVVLAWVNVTVRPESMAAKSGVQHVEKRNVCRCSKRLLLIFEYIKRS